MAGRRKPSLFKLLADDSSGDETSLRPVSVSVSESVIEIGDVHVGDIKTSKRQRKKKGNGGRRKDAVMESAALELEVSGIRSDPVVERRESAISVHSFAKSTQRSVRSRGATGGGDDGNGNSSEMTGSVGMAEKEGSLDWGKLELQHPNVSAEVSSTECASVEYFMGAINGGNALRNTISVGNEEKRESVYNAIFHVPLRCELLIVSGFLVCLNSFLSVLTILPARIVIAVCKVLTTRHLQILDTAEFSDFGCFIVLGFGITILQFTDISLVYHIIRGQGTVKLYVVYNVLEVVDKLLQSFGQDVLQVLFSSAKGITTSQPDGMACALTRFILDQMITVVVFIGHAFILLAQAVTLSTSIIADNNALPALLISNNFAEIKSSVFKRVSKENVRKLAHYDSIERFNITAFMLFVLAQNIMEAEGSWFESFLINALLVYICEVIVDMVKHSCLSKFNEIEPVSYSEFLEDLCKQTLAIQSKEVNKNIVFIPLASVCVVIRVLTPLYATLLPIGPLPWRWFWILIWTGLTYIILTICKILVGLTLDCFAIWYINHRQERKQHVD